MGLATGIGCGITFGFAAPPYDTTTIPSRMWHARASNVTVGGGTTTLADLSGNGKALVNGGAAGTQPTVTTFPGKPGTPSLYFDGGDLLDCASTILPTTSGAIYTLVLVTTYDDTAARVVLDTNLGTGGIALGQSVSGSNTMVWKKGAAFDNGPAAVALTPQWIAVVFKVVGAYTSKTYINAALVATNNATGQTLVPAGSTWGIGRYATSTAFFHKGHFAEGILIAGDASALFPQISTYMVNRYGTPS